MIKRTRPKTKNRSRWMIFRHRSKVRRCQPRWSVWTPFSIRQCRQCKLNRNRWQQPLPKVSFRPRKLVIIVTVIVDHREKVKTLIHLSISMPALRMYITITVPWEQWTRLQGLRRLIGLWPCQTLCAKHSRARVLKRLPTVGARDLMTMIGVTIYSLNVLPLSKKS